MADTFKLEKQYSPSVQKFLESVSCPVTNLPLFIGAKANNWTMPTEFNGEVMSWLGRVILESEITPEELDKIGNILKTRNNNAKRPTRGRKATPGAQ